MRRHIRKLAVAGACTLLSYNAMAAHPLVTDDTSTQDQGNQQLEFNTDRLRDEGARAHVASITYSYGLQPNLDLSANVPLNFSSPRGMGNLSLGAKWRFWEQQHTSIGIKPELLLPSGDVRRQLGTGRTGLAATLLASHDMEPWTIHANAGFVMNRYEDSTRDEGSRRTVWRLSTAAVYAISDSTALVLDVGAARNAERAIRANPAFALVGVIYTPKRYIDIDVGLKFGLNAAEVHRQFGAGLTVRF